MHLLRGIRLLGLSVAAGFLASTALLAGNVPTAGAAQPGLCPLLPILCPPTTVAKAPATTTAPATTAPPKTAAPTTGRPPPTTARTTATNRNTSAVASVGDGALPASPADAGAAAASADDAAPQLAGLPTATTIPLTMAPAPGAVSGLVGASKGLPNDRSTLRVALSLLVLLVAAVAAAQLPASRRSFVPPRQRLG